MQLMKLGDPSRGLFSVTGPLCALENHLKPSPSAFLLCRFLEQHTDGDYPALTLNAVALLHIGSKQPWPRSDLEEGVLVGSKSQVVDGEGDPQRVLWVKSHQQLCTL